MLFELLRRPVTERRMEPLLVVNSIYKLADGGERLRHAAVFLPVDLLVFQRLHERLAGGIRLSRQLRLMQTR